MFLTDWYADYPDPENFTYPLFHSGNKGTGGNYAFYADPRLDEFIVRARTTTDSALKQSLSREIDAMVFEAAPWIFLWYPVDLWAERPEVTGWRIPKVFYGQQWREARFAGGTK
jgi:ABC-type transport system substrate-binding protein